MMSRQHTSWAAALWLLLCSTLAAAEDPNVRLESVFGEEIRKAAAANDPRASLALAVKMLDMAKMSKANARDFALLLGQQTVDLAAKYPAGAPAAIEAMDLLVAIDPNHKADWQDKLLKIAQQQYNSAAASDKTRTGEDLLDRLVAVGDDRWTEEKSSDAAAMFRRALEVAAAVRPDDQESIRAKLKIVNARIDIEARVEQLKTRIKAQGDDHVSREQLVRLCLVDLDNPAEAAKYVASDIDEHLRFYVPLAAKGPAGVLAAPPSLEMGIWYHDLAAKSSAPAKTRMLARAKLWYERYMELHATDDAEKQKAAASLVEIAKELAKAAAEPAVARPKPPPELDEKEALRQVPPRFVAFAKERAKLKPDEQLKATLAMLKEVNGLAGSKELTAHDSKIEGNQITELDLRQTRGLKSIEPLYGLKLNVLSLSECGELTSLNGLQLMPLKSLDLNYCGALTGDLMILRASKLESLGLRSCANLTSLNGIQALPLTSLDVGGCAKIANLKDLAGLKEIVGAPIKNLTLNEWAKLPADLTFLRAMGFKLNSLSMISCVTVTSLSGIQKMPLTSLSIDGCRLANLKELQELKDIRELGIGGDLVRPDLSFLKSIGMRLTYLRLVNCPNLTSLNGIEKMPLQYLYIEGFNRLANLKELQELSALVGLELSGEVVRGDLTFLKSLPCKLTAFRVANCPNLTSLAGIESLPLTDVTVSVPRLKRTDYAPLKKIATLQHVDTGDRDLDAEILAAIKKAKEN